MSERLPVYDESKIKSLSSIDHIRLRPGMYIGRLGDGSHHSDGIYILIKEVIDNSVDEFIMGHGKRVDITTEENGRVTVRDYGRGIPLGKLIECVSVINTGAKYNDEVFQFSVGLNGVGTKAVNALAEQFTVRSVREKLFREASFKRGHLIEENNGKTTEKNGTQVTFDIDRSIFPERVKIKEEFLHKRILYYAYLNSGLTLRLNGESFRSTGGLKDLLLAEVGENGLYEPIHYRDSNLEFSFTHTVNYGETFFSFVNGQFTNDGGTHLSSYREGILKGINEYSKRGFQGVDVRDGMLGAIAVKLKDPIFESQTKNKLSNTDIKGWIVNLVKDVLVDLLHKNEELAKLLVEKCALNEKVRKELQSVKKEARDKAKKAAVKVPGLRDCKYHFDNPAGRSEETQIFITEGQSAMGSLVSCRDAEVQALFAIRGKPLNVFGQKRDMLYRNAELFNIMKALGIEDNSEHLRYNKVVLATDADVDGLHIRNLLITYFLHYFEDVVIRGHLYILETPLFRVRNKKQTHYCYSEAERDRALKKLKEAEITRFKGLGEISPKEFGPFIGEDIRLIQVQVDSLHGVGALLRFYMGSNTPDRKQYIMEHLRDTD